MKPVYKENLTYFILLLLIGTSCISAYEPKKLLYTNNGRNWPGTCSIGQFQSPINIIDKKNTVEDSSVISIDYSIPKNGENSKFTFDGDRLFMDIALGNLAFFNKRGAKEIYQAYRIELHFPSEHYITREGQTPRYALEIQIHHNFLLSSNAAATDKFIKVNKAIISILYTVGEYNEGDEFLESLGISRYNKDSNSEPLIALKNSNISQELMRVGLYDTGFNIKALQGLLNAINSDTHLYHYYGSETTPPCREEVLWFIFGRPRSLSKYQFEYLKAQLAKSRIQGRKLKFITDYQNLFGNKRSIQPWDQTVRGRVFSNLNGIRQVKRSSFFKGGDKIN